MKKKLYYVKREVLATSIEKAVNTRGHIYEITLAADKDHPIEEKQLKGFK